MICPKCRENKAHRSRRDGYRDWLQSLLLRIPYRCHACDERFYVNPGSESGQRLRTPDEKQVVKLRRELRLQAMKRQLVGYGISSLIVAAILYYLFQQRMNTQ